MIEFVLLGFILIFLTLGLEILDLLNKIKREITAISVEISALNQTLRELVPVAKAIKEALEVQVSEE